MSHKGVGVGKCQKSVTFYSNGPLLIVATIVLFFVEKHFIFQLFRIGKMKKKLLALSNAFPEKNSFMFVIKTGFLLRAKGPMMRPGSSFSEFG